MLVFRDINVETPPDGEWYERQIWGAKVRFRIRARTQALVEKIRNAHKKKINGRDVYDEEKISDDVLDTILQDFEGFGEELPDKSVQPFDVNLETKKKILFMEVPFGEQSNFVWVFDRANQAAFIVQEEETKNS
jgi:hypothetical protein